MSFNYNQVTKSTDDTRAANTPHKNARKVNNIKITVFWDVTPSSLVKSYECLEESAASNFREESPEMEAAASSETLIIFYETMQNLYLMQHRQTYLHMPFHTVLTL
jgi:hypothetical protein